MEDINFENRFWLRILRDNVIFIINKLSTKHAPELQLAKDLKMRLIHALATVERGTRPEQLADIEALVLDVRALMIKVLGYHVDPSVKMEISLNPTVINHMLNVLAEYLNILDRVQGRPSEVPHILAPHELWLVNAASNSERIMSELDSVEVITKKAFKKQKKQFHMLHHKTEEFIKYVDRLNTEFPALSTLTQSAMTEIDIFNKLLTELLGLRLGKRVLGTVSPLLINHILRENAYYLRKLGSNVGNAPLMDISE